MKVYLSYQVHCPHCDFVMVREDKTVCCGNQSCPGFRVLYERPSVELQPLSADELSELWTAAAASEGGRLH